MRLIQIIILTLVFSVGLIAQADWIESPMNPVITNGPGWDRDILSPCILEVNDTLKMWYAGYSGGAVEVSIGYGYFDESQGEWVLNESPVFHWSTETWYGSHVWYPQVLYHQQSGTYQMWYAGAYSGMGYATSNNGIDWTPDPDNPVDAPTQPGGWDQHGMITGPVLYEDGVYKIWYWNKTSSGAFGGVGYATSEDGRVWTKNLEQVIPKGSLSGNWDSHYIVATSVFVGPEGYELFYHASASNDRPRIGHSISADGINWWHNPANPIVGYGTAGSWNGEFSAYPCVMTNPNSDNLMMYFSGERSSDGLNQIGIAYGPPVDRVPAAVEGGVALAGYGIVKITWDPHPANDIANLICYRSTTNDTSGCFQVTLDPSAPHYDPYPVGDQTYYYWLAAEDHSGQISELSEVFLVQTPPDVSEHWVKYVNNPVIMNQPGHWDRERFGQCVVRVGDTLKMWYSGKNSQNLQVGYAHSLNGLDWIMNEDPVIDFSEPWIVSRTWIPKVVYDGAQYHMWYLGDYNTIGYAVSNNGITWEKHPDNPINAPTPEGAWDDDDILIGPVLIEDGVFKIWYTNSPLAGGGLQVGYAESVDGYNWTRYPDPVLWGTDSWEIDHIVALSILKEGDLYELWYHGQSAGGRYQIGRAWSFDGLEWFKDPDNPVLSPGEAGEWDDDWVVYPSVIRFGESEETESRWLYYSGHDHADLRIGVATYEAVSIFNRDEYFPDQTALLPAYPNPFNPSTMLRFNLAEPSMTRLAIYDVLGREIKVLMDDVYQAGSYQIQWDASDLSGQTVTTGLYLGRLETEQGSQTIKLLYME